jgi:hypothetical protein
MSTEILTWIPVAERLPDADMTVCIAIDNADEPTWLGFLDGDEWREVDGSPVGGTVTHWAEMLKGPKP